MIGIGGPNPSGLPGFNGTFGLTAYYLGNATTATALPSWLNEVSTVVTTADAVLLPPGYTGEVITVINDGAFALQVYGQGGDTIAGHATSIQAAATTGVAQTTSTVGIYYCFEGQYGNTNAPQGAKWKQALLT